MDRDCSAHPFKGRVSKTKSRGLCADASIFFMIQREFLIKILNFYKTVAAPVVKVRDAGRSDVPLSPGKPVGIEALSLVPREYGQLA